MKLFIDTWGWLTLKDRKETRHREVKGFYQETQNQEVTVYTSDYVLDEVITLLFRRLHFKDAREAVLDLDKAIRKGYLQLEWIIPKHFEKAKELRFKFQDKPKISFTDLTSMVLMDELGIEKILTDDDHFEYVGMGFRNVPSRVEYLNRYQFFCDKMGSDIPSRAPKSTGAMKTGKITCIDGTTPDIRIQNIPNPTRVIIKNIFYFWSLKHSLLSPMKYK